MRNSDRDKSYWIPHLRKLAADNATLRERTRTLQNLVDNLEKQIADDISHLRTQTIEQNAKILTLSIVLEKESNA